MAVRMILPPNPLKMSLCPIHPPWILEGVPVARIDETGRVPGAHCGYWDCSAGRFRWHYGQAEIVYIIAGAVQLRDLADPGSTAYLVAGDSVTFPAGAVIEWTVPDHVCKFFVFADERVSLLKRIYRRLFR